jgi:2-aminoadipate transaminase
MPNSNGLSRRAHGAGGEPLASLLMARTLAQPELVSLAAGFVDHATLPVELTGDALREIWSDATKARAALQYGTNAGYPPLRQQILDRLLRADGLPAAPTRPWIEQVVVTAGSNQLLYLVGDTLLDPGDIVLCGSPTYYVFLGTLGNLGARAVGVDIDQEGLIPEALDERLATIQRQGELSRVKLVYLTSYFDNPTGLTLPADRRQRLMEIVRRWSQKSKIYLLEDVAYRDLSYYGDDTASLWSLDSERDTVIVAGSFSKSYSPGLRVGWGILPPALVKPVLAAKGNLDFGSPNFNQILMAEIVARGLFQQHLDRLRECYREKIDVLADAADRLLGPLGQLRWVRPRGGLYLWIELPESIDAGLSGPLFDRAVAEGVLYVPGEYCYPQEGPPARRNMLRLSFGIPSCDEIRRGMESLARAIRQVLSERIAE